jgi:hypothetical protein
VKKTFSKFDDIKKNPKMGVNYLSLGPFSRPVFDLNAAQNGVRT